MLGIGFDINNIVKDVLPEIDIINLENPLSPNYLNGDYKLDIARFLSENHNKTIITDGAYIDLNPATPEMEVREIVKKKVLQSIDFAVSTGSEEIIFLSTFLPMIHVEFYTDAHIENSVAFWREIAAQTNIRISLCNTFEYEPSVLTKIAQGVNLNNFGLAFDVGHAFAYGQIPLNEFFCTVEPFCKSVYLHSNEKRGDTHLNIFEGDLLKNDQFQEILPLLRSKNILLKPFDKTRLHENLDTLREL